jgi:hypothetical protein
VIPLSNASADTMMAEEWEGSAFARRQHQGPTTIQLLQAFSGFSTVPATSLQLLVMQQSISYAYI